jgi:hypothetical protein
MIRGLHGLFYSSYPEATRAFLRDKVKLPFVDTGDGWLIFDLPEADLGVHPIYESGKPPAGTHDVSFYCDDIQGTVAGMKERGVVFRSEIEDRGYGFVTYFELPGGLAIQLYEPKYQKRAREPAATKAKPKAKAKAKPKAKKPKAKTKRR